MAISQSVAFVVVLLVNEIAIHCPHRLSMMIVLINFVITHFAWIPHYPPFGHSQSCQKCQTIPCLMPLDRCVVSQVLPQICRAKPPAAASRDYFKSTSHRIPMITQWDTHNSLDLIATMFVTSLLITPQANSAFPAKIRRHSSRTVGSYFSLQPMRIGMSFARSCVNLSLWLFLPTVRREEACEAPQE
jgi:hypothetical protein